MNMLRLRSFYFNALFFVSGQSAFFCPSSNAPPVVERSPVFPLTGNCHRHHHERMRALGHQRTPVERLQKHQRQYAPPFLEVICLSLARALSFFLSIYLSLSPPPTTFFFNMHDTWSKLSVRLLETAIPRADPCARLGIDVRRGVDGVDAIADQRE